MKKWLAPVVLAVLVLVAVHVKENVVLTLEQELAILDRLKKGESQEKLSSEYGARRSTISDIKKSEDKLKSYALTMESLSMSSKTRQRLADDEKLDEAVYLCCGLFICSEERGRKTRP